MPRSLCLLSLLSLSTGCSVHHAITGQVIDRNGEPVDRVIVSLSPGNVELVTDSEGRFTIDYLRDESGERTRLEHRQDYEMEVFRPGYHVNGSSFYYKRGELLLAPITMVEDTIEIQQSDADIDPEQYPDRTHSSGTNYEGE